MSSPNPLLRFSAHTDPQVMRSFWNRHLPGIFGIHADVSDCRIAYCRCRTYLKPASWHKSHINICYELDVDGSTQPLYVYGRGYVDGHSLDRHMGNAPAAFSQFPTQDGLLVPEMDMIVWRFPDDPSLPQLPAMLDPERILPHLPLGALGISRKEDVKHIDIRVVRYRPEQRCILRYELHHLPGRSRTVVYAKAFSDEIGEQVYERMHHCHEISAGLGVQLARPLEYSPLLRAVWQTELVGSAVSENILSDTFSGTARAIGRVLARLHAVSFPLSATHTRETRLADARKKSGKLAAFFPELKSGLTTLIANLETTLETLPPGRSCVIHGDMHLGQLLNTPSGDLALFDFDEWSYGEPAHDLADLLADLRLTMQGVQRAENNRARTGKWQRALLEAYGDESETGPELEAVDWHSRVQLINKAYRAAIQQEPGWADRVPELIALAAQGIIDREAISSARPVSTMEACS